MPERLNDRQIEHMELLLRSVIAAITERSGAKADIKEISAEFKADLFQRKRFSVPTYERFVRWCKAEYSVEHPVVERSLAGESLFIINLAHSEITEEDIFDKAVEEYQGKYLFITWVGDTAARITWIELKPRPRPDSLPTFEARRDGIIFSGIYYAFEDSIFIFGHKSISPMSRSIFLTRVAVGKSKDLVGVTSGASYDKTVFASSCYMQSLNDNATIESVEDHIGDKTLDFVFSHYPHIRETYTKFGHVQMDIPRLPDE